MGSLLGSALKIRRVEGKGRTRTERGVGCNSYNEASPAPRELWNWDGPSEFPGFGLVRLLVCPFSTTFHELWKVDRRRKR